MSEAAMAEEAGAGDAPGEQGAPRTVAVDGSAASGKSTIGRRLAAALGYPFLDTGVMYRAVTQTALARGVDVHDPEALSRLAGSLEMEVALPAPGSGGASRILVDGEDVTQRLREAEVEENVSLVSRVPGVREALVRKQREIASGSEGGIVMAGRDIGTVVLPEADVKVYLDASLGERARRRHAEFVRGGQDVSEEMVLRDIRRRDQIDSEREASPLKPAADAVIVSTDGLGEDEVLERVLRLMNR